VLQDVVFATRRLGPGPQCVPPMGTRASLEGAGRVLEVRRAPRWEQTPQIAADLRPQQKVGEICVLAFRHGEWQKGQLRRDPQAGRAVA
jgi:hypothetical protein